MRQVCKVEFLFFDRISIQSEILYAANTGTDQTRLQFCVEAFNVFNHAQFQTSSGNINNSGVGGFGYVT